MGKKRAKMKIKRGLWGLETVSWTNNEKITQDNETNVSAWR